MRLHGSIFIPSKIFLVRFTPFTRTVIIFLGAIWADFRLHLSQMHLQRRNAGRNKKMKQKTKQTPKQSSRETVEKKKNTLF